MTLNVIIPCKELGAGKSRLAGLLKPLARRDLCVELLQRTVRLAAEFVGHSRTWLVTSDRDASDIALSYKVRSLMVSGDGLNRSLNQARRSLLRERPVAEMMIIPIDLPFASIAALELAYRRPEQIVIAPDRNDFGTNVLLLRSQAVEKFRFLYGNNSYTAHTDFARACDLSVGAVRNSILSFDLDEPEDLLIWKARQDALAI
ncbi:MAG: 2-phospho-L-lactate guanylyltransferase [Afipia sp.]|nr:2-phospho-L-lactate guanylyltransferase [Afipia sp.]